MYARLGPNRYGIIRVSAGSLVRAGPSIPVSGVCGPTATVVAITAKASRAGVVATGGAARGWRTGATASIKVPAISTGDPDQDAVVEASGSRATGPAEDGGSGVDAARRPCAGRGTPRRLAA